MMKMKIFLFVTVLFVLFSVTIATDHDGACGDCGLTALPCSSNNECVDRALLNPACGAVVNEDEQGDELQFVCNHKGTRDEEVNASAQVGVCDVKCSGPNGQAICDKLPGAYACCGKNVDDPEDLCANADNVDPDAQPTCHCVAPKGPTCNSPPPSGCLEFADFECTDASCETKAVARGCPFPAYYLCDGRNDCVLKCP